MKDLFFLFIEFLMQSLVSDLGYWSNMSVRCKLLKVQQGMDLSVISNESHEERTSFAFVGFKRRFCFLQRLKGVLEFVTLLSCEETRILTRRESCTLQATQGWPEIVKG